MAVLDAVPVERITTRAAEMDPVRFALALLAFPLLALGWVARKTWMVLWAVVSWSAAAVLVGWESAQAKDEGGS